MFFIFNKDYTQDNPKYTSFLQYPQLYHCFAERILKLSDGIANYCLPSPAGFVICIYSTIERYKIYLIRLELISLRELIRCNAKYEAKKARVSRAFI